MNYYNRKYFDNNSSEISDADYDVLKKEIIDLEKKFKFLNSDNSPSKLVGFKPSKNFNKILHKVPMLSLANAFSKEDLINFQKIINYLDKKMKMKLNIVLNQKSMVFPFFNL